MQDIYILKSCNEWKEHRSAGIIAATTDRHTLNVMICGEILLGNMNYMGLEKAEGAMKMCEDLRNGVNIENGLEYGYVETAECLSQKDIEELNERYSGLENIFSNGYAEIEDDEEMEM